MCISEILCDDIVHILVILEGASRCFKEGQEILGYIKLEKFLTSYRTSDFLKKICCVMCPVNIFMVP